MSNSNAGVKHKITRFHVISIISLISGFLIWQLFVDYGVIPRIVLASPTDIGKLFWHKLFQKAPDGALLWEHAATSLSEAGSGYFLALVVGLPLGLLMGWFGLAEGLVRPIFELIRPIPPVAYIPLAIFWFGIGLTGKVFIIWISGLVPCVINAYIGVKMTNPTLINMARTYGAKNWKIFITICVPSALPMVFSALQIALAYCWITLVAAELVAANKGLGFLIIFGRQLMRPDIILLGMMMVALTGAIISLVCIKIENRLLAAIRR